MAVIPDTLKAFRAKWRMPYVVLPQPPPVRLPEQGMSAWWTQAIPR